MNGDRQRRQQQENNNAGAWVAGAAGVAGIAALIGGGLYYLTRGRAEPQQVNQPSSSSDSDSDTARNHNSVTRSRGPAIREGNSNGTLSYLTGLMDRVNMGNDDSRYIPEARGLRRNPPSNPDITNLNSLLSDIYVRYIALRNEDFELHYGIFDRVFHHLHRTMKQIDPYYERYSSTVSFAGSHYDRLRIKKPDEFDMDIVIGLPLNISDDPFNPSESDIRFEPQDAGFVELKMGVQYQKLPMRDGNSWQINKTAYKWRDDDDYLTRSKFIDWFKSVVVRALNKFETNARGEPVFQVDGLTYSINRTESGPAITLIIENRSTNFRMDVDLVPALRFPEARWPISTQYRQIPAGCNRDYWLIVPKPNKEASSEVGRRRSWRLALHYQERDLMHNTYNLRQTIRLLKKLRDAQKMDKIASYYIKTLFLWEVVNRNDPQFWRLSPAALFKIMVDKFHTALVRGRIDYFWNEDNNLLAGVSRTVLNLYVAKLRNLLDVLAEPNNYKSVAKFLLTPEEFKDYNNKFLHI
ncbi:hypothetical protein ABMA28_015874 [Loxostege sticticalis]|uniref:Cyclic GMP-AMP synthase n=1 Tax=Loxostege sticticalis TaxID=481309 RepID=A0ABD0TBC4_LOXSC